MIHIHTQLIGQPQSITDRRGTWSSAIFRRPITGPVELQHRGLVGDQVADTEHHGSPDQAVCCHPLGHYVYWNRVYALDTADTMLGPGSVGENWTLSDATEQDLCIGDVFAVGDARVRVSGPRYPCTKQERKLKLPMFHRRTLQTLRTGLYLRVLTPAPYASAMPGGWRTVLTPASRFTASTSGRTGPSTPTSPGGCRKCPNSPRAGSAFSD